MDNNLVRNSGFLNENAIAEKKIDEFESGIDSIHYKAFQITWIQPSKSIYSTQF